MKITSDVIESGVTLTDPVLAGTKVEVSSNELNISGVGKRITGDFSNATVADRVMFQTSTTDTNTVVGFIPNGTGTTAELETANNSGMATARANTLIGVSTTESYIKSDRRNLGTYLPMTFYTGGTEKMRIDTSGNVGIGASSAVAGARTFTISNTDAGAGSYAQSVLTSNSGSLRLEQTSVAIGGQSNIYTTGNYSLRLGANSNASKLTINPTGPIVLENTLGFINSSNLGYLSYGGGTSNILGANLFCFGESYAGTPNTFEFRNSGNTLRMTLDASGNVGVGTTPSSGIRVLAKGTGTTGSTFSFFAQNSAGSSTFAVSDDGVATVTKGVGFPVTQVPSSDPNTLDDYEEGAWVPQFASSGGTYVMHASNAGSYTKIGRQVTVIFLAYLSTSGNTLTGNELSITGLPFTASGLHTWTSFYWAGTTTSLINCLGAVNAATNTITLSKVTAATTQPTQMVGTDLHATNGSYIYGTVTYFTS